MTTTSGSPEELPVVEAPLPKGSSGSVELEFELIVFPISLMHYQLTIWQSLDQRFLNHFLLFLSNILPAPPLPAFHSRALCADAFKKKDS